MVGNIVQENCMAKKYDFYFFHPNIMFHFHWTLKCCSIILDQKAKWLHYNHLTEISFTRKTYSHIKMLRFKCTESIWITRRNAILILTLNFRMRLEHIFIFIAEEGLKKIVGRVDFCDQFRKIIVRYKRIGYNINIMRQSACLVFNPITVNNFASLFNCTPVGRASDSMMAPT